MKPSSQAGIEALEEAGYNKKQIEQFKQMRKIFEKAAYQQARINRGF